MQIKLDERLNLIIIIAKHEQKFNNSVNFVNVSRHTLTAASQLGFPIFHLLENDTDAQGGGSIYQFMFATAAALKEICGNCGKVFVPGISSADCKTQAPINGEEKCSVILSCALGITAFAGKTRLRQGPKRDSSLPCTHSSSTGKAIRKTSAALIFPLLFRKVSCRIMPAQCFNSSVLKGRQRRARGATQGKW